MNDVAKVIYVLRIFHGGRFVNGNELVYVGGDVVEYEVDPNKEQDLLLPPNDSGVLGDVLDYDRGVVGDAVDEAIRDNGLDGAKDNGLGVGMNEANKDDGLDEGLNVACKVDEYETFLIDVAYLSDNDDEEI
ncbi:hypothetical protein REPUB_Repub03eG0096400 [Reevesia pubescens]